MNSNAEIIQKAISGSLDIIEQDREKEIISRRFGLNGYKETLEQIGDSLSITRERVRQLEKAILIRLRISAGDGTIPALAAAEKLIVRNLTELGRVARLDAIASKIYDHPATSAEKLGINFIANFSKSLFAIAENDHCYPAIGIAEYGDEESTAKKAAEIVAIVKKAGEPITIDALDEQLNYEHPDHISAIASVSKDLASLGNTWGLSKWPTVNPKNIRDKIFVILSARKEPLHYSEISKEIASSNFKRRNVTVQAIHNELIKDPRFVLVGRGIYALSEWGFTRGTIRDLIIDYLREAGEPKTREEIVKHILSLRKVKETTVLLNLQSTYSFKKVGKNSYTLSSKMLK